MLPRLPTAQTNSTAGKKLRAMVSTKTAHLRGRRHSEFVRGYLGNLDADCSTAVERSAVGTTLNQDVVVLFEAL